MQAYFDQVAKCPLLTRFEECELGKRCMKGDKWARDKLITANLRYVIKVAKDRKYEGRGLTLEELIQEGNIGLCVAADKFNPSKGRFTTIADKWIRHHISRAIEDTSLTVRMPVKAHKDRGRLRQVTNSLSTELGRDPTDAEIIAEDERLAFKRKAVLTQTRIDELRQAELNITLVSLDVTSSQHSGQDGSNDGSSGHKLADSVAAPTQVRVPYDGDHHGSRTGFYGGNEQRPTADFTSTIGLQQDFTSIIILKEALRKALAPLPETDRAMLHMRFGLFDEKERETKEIAEFFKCSTKHVNSVVRGALELAATMPQMNAFKEHVLEHAAL